MLEARPNKYTRPTYSNIFWLSVVDAPCDRCVEFGDDCSSQQNMCARHAVPSLTRNLRTKELHLTMAGGAQSIQSASSFTHFRRRTKLPTELNMYDQVADFRTINSEVGASLKRVICLPAASIWAAWNFGLGFLVFLASLIAS